MQQSQCIHHEETCPRPRLTIVRLVVEPSYYISGALIMLPVLRCLEVKERDALAFYPVFLFHADSWFYHLSWKFPRQLLHRAQCNWYPISNQLKCPLTGLHVPMLFQSQLVYENIMIRRNLTSDMAKDSWRVLWKSAHGLVDWLGFWIFWKNTKTM